MASKGNNSSGRTSFNLFGSLSKESASSRVLTEEILASEQVESNKERDDSLNKIQEEKKDSNDWQKWANLLGDIVNSSGGAGDSKSSVDKLVGSARDFLSEGGETTKSDSQDEEIKRFESEVKMVGKQLEGAFAEINFDKLNPMAFGYYLEQQDMKKNPSWKRRQHRFSQPLDLETIEGLHDALYLAELSYTDSVEEITDDIAKYDGPPYELIYCTTEAQPREPAHFVCLKKSAKLEQTGFWATKPPLEVLMVIRGTKELQDVLSDALLESRDYRGYKAHDGICQSGAWLVEKHLPLFEHLLKESGRPSIKLQLIGHSLGAGAAAIACLDFNDHAKIDATCCAFACPALVSKELAVKCQDKITTIINDSDCIPRCSKAAVVNLLLDVMAFDWTPSARIDVEQFLEVLNKNLPFDVSKAKQKEISDWFEAELIKTVKKDIDEATTERMEVELFPPGRCIHLFRDGAGISATYMDNDFFNEIDFARTMVDDHYIPQGYNKTFTELMQVYKKDTKYKFRNDLLPLRFEKVVAETQDGEKK